MVVSGEVFSNKHLLRRYRRWCDHCWREDVARGSPSTLYHRTEWDLLPLGVCSQHASPFRNECSECGGLVLWRTKGLEFCQCGASLLEQRGSQGCDLWFPGAFQHYVRARLDQNALGSWLDEHPLWSIIGLVEGFGSAAIHGLSKKRPKLNRRQVTEARDLGFELVNDWPNGATSVFESLLGNRSNLSGLTEAYGWVYAWLSSRRPDALAVVALEVLTKHARERRLIAPSEDILKPPEAGTISLFGASKVLGMSHLGARRLLTDYELIPEGSRRGVEFRLSRSAILELAAERRACVYQRGLGALLKTGKKQVDALVAAGHIEPVFGSAKGAPKLFRIADVNRLLDQLRGTLRTNDEPDRIPMAAACQIARVSVSDTIAAILAGAVTSAPINGEGLRGVGVSWQELKAFKAKGRPPMGAEQVDRLPVIN